MKGYNSMLGMRMDYYDIIEGWESARNIHRERERWGERLCASTVKRERVSQQMNNGKTPRCRQ